MSRKTALIISGDKDSMDGLYGRGHDERTGSGRTLFDECVANLSRDAVFHA
ncbi:MAG: hypothetical protein ACLUVG_05365 [Phocaeicola vulgatus]